MFNVMARAVVVATALAVWSISTVAADDLAAKAERLYEPVISGPVSGLTALCNIHKSDGTSFQQLATDDERLGCDLANSIIIHELRRQGYL